MPSTQTYAIAASAVVAVGIGVGGWFAVNQNSDFSECGGGVATGVATIGGPFTLVDHTGATVTAAEVIDKPTFVYFGYTFCPDVCPVDAAVMAQVADGLADEGHDVNTVFVTVDPERDTPEILAEFVNAMHPDMRGLSGTPEQIAETAKSYKVYYQKAEGDDPEYYLMDHSAFIYLMAPEHGFLQIYRHGEPAPAIIDSARCYLDLLPSVEASLPPVPGA